VPARPAQPDAVDRVSPVLARYEALDFSGALTEIGVQVNAANLAIVGFSPWVVAKDPGRKAELDAFLYRLLEDVRRVALLVSPVTTRASARILAMLGLPAATTPDDLQWGRLEPGTPLGLIEPLFPRIEKEKKETPVSDQPQPPAAAPAAPAAPAPAPAAGGKIDIADFAKVELRVAQILAAEKIEGSKKLIKLQVDLGDEKRQVVAGIAEAYAPEALVGKKIALVANLKPAKLMGVESNGMILAASLDGKAVLTTFDADVPPGTKIK
jgi:methionyl-tRNA synthetase